MPSSLVAGSAMTAGPSPWTSAAHEICASDPPSASAASLGMTTTSGVSATLASSVARPSSTAGPNARLFGIQRSGASAEPNVGTTDAAGVAVTWISTHWSP